MSIKERRESLISYLVDVLGYSLDELLDCNIPELTELLDSVRNYSKWVGDDQ